MIPSTYNVVERGLRNTAQNTQAVDCDIPFFTQCQNASPHGFAYCHHDHPRFLFIKNSDFLLKRLTLMS
nr:MAG TPA: hypothetical protein [Caudoviricetes sp.]